jgi:phosphoribosylformylglycinamidine cyclo-ligase
MYRTFNCGVGMVIAVPAGEQDNALSILRAAGENAFVIGSIAKATGDEHQVELQGL